MRPERTLVLLKHYLGDAVMTEPLMSALAENFAHIDAHAPPPVQQILGQLGHRVSFVQGEKIKTLRETMQQAKKLRRKGYDIAIMVNRSFRSALLARLAKIPVRVGHGTEGRSFLLTHSVPYSESDFEAKSYADLLNPLGISVTDVFPKLVLPLGALERGTALLDGATVCIQPGARRADKTMPKASLVALVESLNRRGERIALVGGREEADLASTLVGEVNVPMQNLVGKTDIPETMAVLKGVRLAVGGDTGVMHVAAGLGTPTVTVFGATNAAKWAHRYAPHHVIVAPEGDIERVSPEMLVAEALAALPNG